jgi:hypothetical protein
MVPGGDPDKDYKEITQNNITHVYLHGFYERRGS